jgi:hypothetical protein
MAHLPNQRLSPYEVLSAVGAGGMGEVYRARDKRLDRTVAIMSPFAQPRQIDGKHLKSYANRAASSWNLACLNIANTRPCALTCSKAVRQRGGPRFWLLPQFLPYPLSSFSQRNPTHLFSLSTTRPTDPTQEVGGC